MYTQAYSCRHIWGFYKSHVNFILLIETIQCVWWALYMRGVIKFINLIWQHIFQDIVKQYQHDYTSRSFYTQIILVLSLPVKGTYKECIPPLAYLDQAMSWLSTGDCTLELSVYSLEGATCLPRTSWWRLLAALFYKLISLRPKQPSVSV